MYQNKANKVSFKDWIKENMAIPVAILFFMLCIGLIEEVVVPVINKTLVYVAGFEGNAWLSWLFFVLTGICVYYLVKHWFKAKRIVSPSLAGVLFVLFALYFCFRLVKTKYYSFACYWESPIAYLDGFALVCALLVGYYLIQQYNRLKEFENPDVNKSNYTFGLDAPIENSEDDIFNMGSLVNRIAAYIAYTNVSKGAFSMGIVGDWGDGKTSLMNLVEEKIKKDYNNFVIVHFNPRASKKAAFIQEDFLEELKTSLSPHHSGINRIIDSYAVALDAIPGLPLFVVELLSLLQIHIDKNRRSMREVLKNSILEIGRRIVVFVDDLDRLTGEELIEVMKVLDTNGAFPSMVFVTSYDKDYVNTVLANYLKLGTQKRPYTDKYFTVEINVPAHPAFRLMNQLVKLLREACEKGFISEKTIDAKRIEELTLQLTQYLKPRLKTIRDVKRFANQFLYDYADVQRDVNYHDFLLLELIKYAHPDEYVALRNLEYIHRGTTSFTTTASNDLYYLNDKLLSKKKPSGDGFEEPEVKPDCLDILNHLFPVESEYRSWYAARHLRIYSVSSFDHYFYNYEYSHLRTDDIDALYKTATLKEACEMIDSWMPYFKDFETYLLTRGVESIRSKKVLRQYFQFLLYGGYKQPSINYLGQNYSFIRKEDVEEIINNCGFADLDDYLAWLKESLDELFDIEPVIPSSFVCWPIKGLSEPDAEPDLFVVSVEYLQKYALELLKRYLAMIDEEGWSANKAYNLAQIPLDMSEELLPAALEALHEVMVNRFEKFSSSVLSVSDYNNHCVVGYNVNMAFWVAFKDKDEFACVINSNKYDNAPEIKLVRGIWPLFKANNYHTVTLPQGIDAKTAKDTLLKDALDDYSRYEEVDGNLDGIADEWNKGHKLINVDSFISRTEKQREALRSIPLKLKIAKIYEIQITDMINQFKEYVLTARNLDASILRVGDIVRMKQTVFVNNQNEHPDKMVYSENLFTVANVGANEVRTLEFDDSLNFDEIEAVLIDGKEDAAIYYDSYVAADVVAECQATPSHNRNYSYYMDQFKKCFVTDEESYYNKVEKAGFQFVHEVQHWLTDEMHGNGLKVYNTISVPLKLGPVKY